MFPCGENLHQDVESISPPPLVWVGSVMLWHMMEVALCQIQAWSLLGLAAGKSAAMGDMQLPWALTDVTEVVGWAQDMILDHPSGHHLSQEPLKAENFLWLEAERCGRRRSQGDSSMKGTLRAVAGGAAWTAPGSKEQTPVGNEDPSPPATCYWI